MTSPPGPLPPITPRPSDAAGPAQVFDRRLLALRRARAAPHFSRFSFLKQAAADDIALRLTAINRNFDRILDLGSHDGLTGRTLAAHAALSGRIGEVVCADLAPAFPARPLGVAASEEMLPFADQSFDLVVSALSLHWVNDLPGALIQIRRALKPDGLFIGVLLGGRTLTELRQALLGAETDLRGGARQRVSPFLDVLDGAQLLQRAGFAMPVGDCDALTVRYASALALIRDVQGMGESAAPANRTGPGLTSGILRRSIETYADRFSDPDGRVRATFEFIALSGWAPGPDQPVPRKPGSASVRLADALGVKEFGADDAPGPRRDPT